MMATVRKLALKVPERVSKQSDTNATIALIEFEGERFIQIDSVGSDTRQLVGKRSQSMRLSEEAFQRLVEIGTKHFSEKN
jgi:hypothetical protein